ncbi:MAG: hybrid sensor histidine kinase/response regulator [Anaerolineae bacterium]|nr:hybrid sensor histidine kinase/response regulator [Anaerolineae bacterium]
MATRPEVLIVDDKPQNLFALAQLLRAVDVDVVQAAAGAQALALALEHDFCVAIVDVQMPEMDGYELVELLRGNESTASLPVIFVSAIFSDEYHHRKGYDAGAVDFLSKPFVPEILISKVKVFIDLYHQRRKLQALVEELDRANDDLTQLNAQIVALNAELEERVRQRTAELQKAYHELALLDRNKSDFIQVIAHELRTPLTLVRGYGQMLLETSDFEGDAARCQQVHGIVVGSDRIHSVVNSMLDMVRIESGTVALDFQPLYLSELMESLHSSVEQVLIDRRLALTLDAGLSQLPVIEADPESMQKLFEQLLLNAIKYTPDGGAITISGRCVGDGTAAQAADADAQAVEIVVSDTGIGIAPDLQNLIFHKFYRTERIMHHSTGKTKFKGGGPGLGLAIARGIVDIHNGRIWVESPGYDEATCPGSQFHVVLPVQQGSPSLLST